MPRGSTKYPLPISPGGVREDAGLVEIKDGELLSSLNWLTREGLGQPRPGYAQVGSTLAAADRVIGFGFRGSRDIAASLFIHTLTAGYVYTGSAFTDITGTWSASSATQPVRFASFTKNASTAIYRVNQANAVQKSTGAAFAAITNAPVGSDITVCGGRTLVARAGGIQRTAWSDFNDPDTFTVGEFAELSETTGDMVACRAFGPLRAGIYMDDAVYLATVQASRQPFAFNLIAQVPGPSSPSALVEHEGTHYWLGKDGVVYSFDGAGVHPMNNEGDHLARTVRNTFEWSERLQSHGCLLEVQDTEIWFFLPVTSTSNINFAISINTKTGAMNPHFFGHSISASASWVNQNTITIDGLDAYSATIDGLDAVFPTIDSMGGASFPTSALGSSVGDVYRFGNASKDKTTDIPWNFVHGWKAPAGIGNRLHLDAVASYWKKLADSLTVTLGVTLSDSLSEDDTTDPEHTTTFDLATGSNHLQTFSSLTAAQRRGQFVKVKHSATSTMPNVEHRGALILGWPKHMTP
jgi:hypothetical protein